MQRTNQLAKIRISRLFDFGRICSRASVMRPCADIEPSRQRSLKPKVRNGARRTSASGPVAVVLMAEKQALQYAVGMFAHIQIGVRDLKAMAAFYDAVLSELGLLRDTDLGHVGPAGVIWRLHGSRWPQFVINLPFDGKPSTTANGSQVSFLCASRSAVDAAWSAAISQSALDLGAPGVRTRYAADFYAAYCSDPEGNKLCFVYTDPKP